MRILMLAIALSMFAAFGAARAETVRLQTGQEYVPYIDHDRVGGGLYTEIIRESYRMSGHDLALEIMPWKRSYAMVEAGRALGTFSWAYSAEREKQFHLSPPFFRGISAVFTSLASLASWPSAELLKPSLDGLRFCLPHGWTVSPVLRDLVEAGRIARSSARGMRGCFEQLALRRADIVIADLLQGRRWQLAVNADGRAGGKVEVGAEKGATVRMLSAPLLPRGTSHILFARTPAGSGARESFARGLAKIRANGTYDGIVTKYFAEIDDLTRTAILSRLGE